MRINRSEEPQHVLQQRVRRRVVLPRDKLVDGLEQRCRELYVKGFKALGDSLDGDSVVQLGAFLEGGSEVGVFDLVWLLGECSEAVALVVAKIECLQIAQDGRDSDAVLHARRELFWRDAEKACLLRPVSSRPCDADVGARTDKEGVCPESLEVEVQLGIGVHLPRDD